MADGVSVPQCSFHLLYVYIYASIYVYVHVYFSAKEGLNFHNLRYLGIRILVFSSYKLIGGHSLCGNLVPTFILLTFIVLL